MGEEMKIGLVAGPVYSCPPRGYGGAEMVTAGLARELAQLKHEVHLFGAPGTESDGAHVHYVPGTYGEFNHPIEAEAWELYSDLFLTMDVVHDLSPHCYIAEVLSTGGHRTPRLFTKTGMDYIYPRAGRQNAVFVSRFAAEHTRMGQPTTMTPKWVLNGIDTTFYRPGEEPRRDYILYLGRPHPDKGVELVVETARRLPNQQFILAWRPAAPDHARHADRYTRMIDGLANVEVVTMPLVDHHEFKRNLYQNARLFLSPHRYQESFGLTSAEALACGVPVVTGSNGAAREVLDDEKRVVGQLVDTNGDDRDVLDQTLKAIDAASTLDPHHCRSHAVEQLSAGRMARDYLQLYEQVATGEVW